MDTPNTHTLYRSAKHSGTTVTQKYKGKCPEYCCHSYQIKCSCKQAIGILCLRAVSLSLSGCCRLLLLSCWNLYCLWWNNWGGFTSRGETQLKDWCITRGSERDKQQVAMLRFFRSLSEEILYKVQSVSNLVNIHLNWLFATWGLFLSNTCCVMLRLSVRK